MTVQCKQGYSSGKLKYLTESLNKYATTTVVTKNDNVANISKEKLKSTGKILTLRRLMSYIYGAPILDVSRSHTTTQHSR